MIIKFKIVTNRDKAMIKSFVVFLDNIKHRHVTIRLCIIGILMLSIVIFVPGNLIGILIFSILGILFLVFGIFRHSIATAKIYKTIYTDTEILINTYVFEDSGLNVYTNESLEKAGGSYKQIASFYENEKNFFILMNEDELYVLPKKDFVIGDVDEFRQYIETKICTKVIWIPEKPVNKFKKLLKRRGL